MRSAENETTTAPTMKTTLLLLLLPVASLTSCNSQEEKPTSSAESSALDLRILPPKGLKGVYHTDIVGRFNNALGGGGKIQTETKVEVIDASDESVSATLDFKGTRKNTANAVATDDYNGSRFCKLKVNRDGTQLVLQGVPPDEIPFSVGVFKQPLKIGEAIEEEDKTTGPGSGKVKSVRILLKGVVDAKGRKLANVETVMKGDTSGTLELWVDLETGVIAKSTGRLNQLQPDGEEMIITTSTYFVDSAGQRWID